MKGRGRGTWGEGACSDNAYKSVNSYFRKYSICNRMLSIIFFLGLEKNETAPKPTLQKPRRPSNKEKEEAVQFSIERKNGVSTIILPMDFLRISCNRR